MSDLTELARIVGSRRLARDLIESLFNTETVPWWPIPEEVSLKDLIMSVGEYHDKHPERERVIPRTNLEG